MWPFATSSRACQIKNVRYEKYAVGYLILGNLAMLVPDILLGQGRRSGLAVYSIAAGVVEDLATTMIIT